MPIIRPEISVRMSIFVEYCNKLAAQAVFNYIKNA